MAPSILGSEAGAFRLSAPRSGAYCLARRSLMCSLRADAKCLADLRPRRSLAAGDSDQFVQGGLVVGEIAFHGGDSVAQPADFVQDVALPVVGGTLIFRRPDQTVRRPIWHDVPDSLDVDEYQRRVKSVNVGGFQPLLIDVYDRTGGDVGALLRLRPMA